MQRLVQDVSKRFTGWNDADLARHRRRLTVRLAENPQVELVQPKLEELVILEFTEDGGRLYHHFTVRELYNHVMKAITDVPNASYSENVIPLSPEHQRKVMFASETTHAHHDVALPERIEVFDSLQNSRLGAESPPLDQKKFQHIESSKVTYRERLGGHLHPRDMRRMVIPFSRSNEPALIVRRHAMLLNFDPLRAIILRDRLLVLVPDGADSVLEELEGRLRGGLADVEHDVFGDIADDAGGTEPGVWGSEDVPLIPTHRLDTIIEKKESGSSHYSGTPKPASSQSINLGLPPPPQPDYPSTFYEDEGDEDRFGSELDVGELNELEGRTWINLPFELQCVDAVLHSITELLASQASEIQDDTVDVIDRLLDPSMGVGEFAQEMLRTSKNNVNDMVSRVQWFMRALTQVLNEDEDMALMNLSRLITHPERFIQPVHVSVLEEESDEPELILEAYLQQAVSLTTELDLMKGQLQTTEELMNMKSDAIRNKILYVNMVITIIMVALTIESLIAGFFGMNLPNRLMESKHEWVPIVAGTAAGGFVLVCVIMLLLQRWGIVYSTV